MKILLAGASGAIGTPLARQLICHGHQVLGLTHTRSGADQIAAVGAKPVVADALDRDQPAARGRLVVRRRGCPRTHHCYGLLYGGNVHEMRALLGWVHHDDAAAATVAALEHAAVAKK